MCKACDGLGTLLAFGACDTCRGVTEAYRLYRYNLFKEKYQNYGRQN